MESEEKVRNKVKRKLRIDEKRLINLFDFLVEVILDIVENILD
mgnify:CR=1 FL=1